MLVYSEGNVAWLVEEGEDEYHLGPEISCSSWGDSLSYYIQTPKGNILGRGKLTIQITGSKQCKGWTKVHAVVCLPELPSGLTKRSSS